MSLQKLDEIINMNRNEFIQNWIDKYYVEGADDETGNLDYLRAEGEKEHDISFLYGYSMNDLPLEEDTVKETDDKINEPIKEKENRNEYMKSYYEKNKIEIINKSCVKEKCEYCNRMVGHQNMFRHQKTKFCNSRRIHKQNMLIN
jgi:hypothetical protein